VGSAAENTSVQPPQPRLHLGYIDGMRALAALYVVVGHMRLAVWPAEYRHYPTGIDALVTGWTSFGHLSVSAFIVISGFCLALPVARTGNLRGGARTFFLRRAKRILPPYYFALALSVALILTLIGERTGNNWDGALPLDLPSVLAHVTLLQDVFYPGKINGPMWSTAVEWHIYFLFPLMVICWFRFGLLLTTALALVLSAIAYAGLLHTWFGSINAYGVAAIAPQYVGLFALGALAAHVAFSGKPVYSYIRDRFPWGFFALASFALVVLYLITWGSPSRTFQTPWVDFFMGIFVIGLLISAARPDAKLLRGILGWKPLAFVGVFSYSIYLIHLPLVQVFWRYVLTPLNLSDSLTYALLVAVGLPLIVAISYAFFLLCERPFMNTRPTRAAKAATA
jgi:peptidoglycan/LPS O-acetylase OafA/YrhL